MGDPMALSISSRGRIRLDIVLCFCGLCYELILNGFVCMASRRCRSVDWAIIQ